MLETMRNASKGWLAIILIILLIASFGIWGVQDMVRVDSAPKIATVGGEDVSPERFQREFSAFLRKMTRESKVELSTVEAKALGLDRQALDQLLNRLALIRKAESLGFNASPAQVTDTLKANLPDGQGGINFAALQQILQESQMGQEEFMTFVGGDIVRQQVLRTLLAGIDMPAGLEGALHRFRLERRVAEYVLIDPSRAGEIKDPDDATLRKYYDTHAGERYSSPEYRTVTVITARAADVASRINVTEDEIKKTYEARRRVYETPEKRTLEQIRFKTEAGAREAKTKLDAGQSFESVAAAQGYKPDDVKLGDVSKTDTTIPAAAFDLPLNKISDPIKGPFGWVILRALSSTPGTVKTLAEVHDEIKQAFVTERSKELLIDLTADFEDTLGGGATLEETAKKHNLPVQKVDAVDARGNGPDGQSVANLPGGEFLGQVFAAESGADSETNETSDGIRYVFRVDKVTPQAKKPLATVRDQLLADWRDEELAKRLTKIADDLVKQANVGEKMSAIASSLGVAALRTDPMARYGKTGIFGPETVAAAARAKIGDFFSGPVAEGKSLVVARLAEIQYQDESPDAPLRASYGEQLRQAFNGDFAEQLTYAVRDEVGVTIDEKKFQEFHTGE
ncbi:MAG: peptidyl-prolyl cis-trans isomerase [Alphaproteobacteria bacterium]|nr:peptidyl-prolyl cis-trans isomerase [Alphaproteobacteria bacterium]